MQYDTHSDNLKSHLSERKTWLFLNVRQFKGKICNDTGGRPVIRSPQHWFAQNGIVHNSTTKRRPLVTTTEGKKQKSQ